MNNLSESITSYWPFLTAIIATATGGIVAWVNTKRDVRDLRDEIAEFKSNSIEDRKNIRNEVEKIAARIEGVNPTLISIQKDMVEIKTILRIHFKEIIKDNP